jgi:hypothetical protein
MRTLIRASQLHPDISGLISGYTSNLYPNYSDILAGSGMASYVSGKSLVLGLRDGASVSSINGISGKLNFFGRNGLRVFTSGNSGVYFDLTGFGAISTLNGLSGSVNIQGSGIADVYPINNNTIRVNVPELSGIDGVNVFHSGGKIYIGQSSDPNEITIGGQNIEIYGEHGASVRITGGAVYIGAFQAAHSGVNSLNSIKNGNVELVPGKDIRITPNQSTKQIYVEYIGSGWGDDYFLTNISGKKNLNWIGEQNFFNGDSDVFSQGRQNGFIQNNKTAILNGSNNFIVRCEEVAALNPHRSYISGISGTTLVNANIDNNVYQNDYSFMVGTPNVNTFFNTSLMTAKVTGFNSVNFNPIKKMKIPKSKRDGIFIQTGSVLIGHIDYVAAAYHITDFYASSNVVNNGMYGRKYFTIQRTNNVIINVRDEADLFGGSDRYNIVLSGANDANLYLLASGYSGHNVFFMANVQYTQFSLNLLDE